MSRGTLWAVVAGALALSACGDGGSAVETRDRTRTETVAGDQERSDRPLARAEAEDRAEPVAAPVTANRRETADAKVVRLFERNGAAFGARTAEDYMARVKTFTERPPADAETVSRPNGDTLIYQASTNTFAVVARDGTPRTMFKPDDGPAYWAEQKAAAPGFGQRRNGG